MTSTPYRHRYALVATAVIAMAWSTAHEASAQAVYRIVGADGRVTFTDRAPDSLPGNSVPAGTVVANVSAANGNELPAALRALQARFPVVLYSGNDCSPCASARALLQARGIPFTERTVSTAADVLALQALSGQSSLPFASIGRQHLEGFAADEWTSYLDAAGYPQTSVLPANYRRAAPSPLAAQAPATPAAAAAPVRSPALSAAPASRVSPTNPAGLSF